MQISQDIRLDFLTHLGHVVNLRIPYARSGLTNEQVITAMDGVILSDAMITTQGRPIARASARLIQRNQTEFTLNN